MATAHLVEQVQEPGRFEDATLPWGMPIRVRANEFIGTWIRSVGAYEMHVAEAIIRLLDPGELAVDVGANIGQMTAAMAWRVGPGGRVMAFEPSREIHADLLHNVRRWRAAGGVGEITVHPLAVSARHGEAALHIPVGSEHNCGRASLEPHAASPAAQRDEQVRVVPLDNVLAGDAAVGLVKIDVEGHELAVLEGARTLLQAGRVRDVVFEEYASYPAPSHRLLERHGYTVFRVSGTWERALLLGAADPEPPSPYEMPNYLATRDAARARQQYAADGWQVWQAR